MRKKAIITTAVAFLLLLAVIAAGLNAIFTITYVRADFLTFSEAGEDDAQALQAELNKFVGKSTTFLKLKEVSAAVDDYPCFRLESAEKKFPKTIAVTVSERKETFAYPKADGGFSVFDEDGIYLYDREKNVSRTGGENILLNGFNLVCAQGEEVSGEYFGELLSACSVFAERLKEYRANVVSVTLNKNGSRPEMDSVVFQMTEGVEIELSNPSFRTAEKARAALDTYFALADGERLCGCILAIESALEDTILCSYTRK